MSTQWYQKKEKYDKQIYLITLVIISLNSNFNSIEATHISIIISLSRYFHFFQSSLFACLF